MVAAAVIVLTPAPAHADKWPTYYGGQVGEVIVCDSNHFGVAYNRSGGVWRELVHCDGNVAGRKPDGKWSKWNGMRTGEFVFCRGRIKVRPYWQYPGWYVAYCHGKTLKGW